jgi:rRNA-processing protein FCF1
LRDITSTVIVDTSALLAMFEFRVDIEAELQRLLGKVDMLVPSSVIDELERLSKTKRDASAALALIEKRGFEVTKVRGKGDKAIFDLASERRCPVLTNDRALRERLRGRSLPVIFLRGLSKLDIEGVSI